MKERPKAMTQASETPGSGEAPERALVAAPRDQLYRAMFEVNTAIKLLIDPGTGRLVDANPAAVEFYGWPLDVLRTMRITDINTQTPAEVEAEMQNAKAGRRTYFRFRHRTARGEVRHVEVHSGPIEVGDQQLLFSIVHDVTERDRLEEQLQQAQRLEAIGRLAGGIAHDFNNLLTVLLTTAGAMDRHVEDDSPLHPYVADITDAAQRGAALTRELLAFSRRQMMQPRPFQLNDAVRELESLLRWTVGTSIDLQIELLPSIPLVHADPSRIDQVIMNLVLNARDAMPDGGRLAIRTELVTVDESETAVVPAGRWVTLSVSDTGTGMDEATRARLFEPFYTTKPASQGTGLGLSTAYGIVAQSGGYISVSSEMGAGSELTVYLPLGVRGDAAAAPRLVPRDPPAPVGRCRVLLVEDTGAVRTALAGALRSAGFDVLEAGSGDEALTLSDSELTCLQAVVTDLVMPGRSGIELVAALRERVPEIPVLLISGDLREHHDRELPPDVRLLQKPFEGDDLARAVLDLVAPQRC